MSTRDKVAMTHRTRAVSSSPARSAGSSVSSTASCAAAPPLKCYVDGEFTRVGTCDVENVGGPEVRPTLESSGNTR